MSDPGNLREGLFNAEPLSVERRQRFHDELNNIVEPKLPRSHRLYYTFAFAGAVMGVLGSAVGAVFDAQHRWLQIPMLGVWLLFAGWIFFILKRGAEPLRMMQSLSKALSGLSFAAAGVMVYLAMQAPTLGGILWVLAALLIFLLVSFINIWNRLLSAERTMREQILRVEYRVAEMAQIIGRP